jgi:hypothetical protein
VAPLPVAKLAFGFQSIFVMCHEPSKISHEEAAFSKEAAFIFVSNSCTLLIQINRPARGTRASFNVIKDAS